MVQMPRAASVLKIAILIPAQNATGRLRNGPTVQMPPANECARVYHTWKMAIRQRRTGFDGVGKFYSFGRGKFGQINNVLKNNEK